MYLLHQNLKNTTNHCDLGVLQPQKCTFGAMTPKQWDAQKNHLFHQIQKCLYLQSCCSMFFIPMQHLWVLANFNVLQIRCYSVISHYIPQSETISVFFVWYMVILQRYAVLLKNPFIWCFRFRGVYSKAIRNSKILWNVFLMFRSTL